MPTHGRADRLSEVLVPLLEDPATSEVVVAVDGADAEAEAVLRGLAERDARVRWVVLDDSVGTARAKLAAARASTAELLVLLDDDVRALPGLVSRHLAAHRERAGLVVVGAMPVETVGERRVLDDLAGRVYQRNYEQAQDTFRASADNVLSKLWGGNVSVRREDYLALADKILRYPRVAHEDAHFGLSARSAGLVGRYDDSAAAVHLHQRTWAGMLDEAERQGRGQRALHRIHHPDQPFASDALPEPLNPLVEWVVLHSDGPRVRRLMLSVLRLASAACLTLGTESTSVRLAFAGTQIARRVGRLDESVDQLVASAAATRER